MYATHIVYCFPQMVTTDDVPCADCGTSSPAYVHWWLLSTDVEDVIQIMLGIGTECHVGLRGGNVRHLQ